MGSSIRKGRKSIFREVGLVSDRSEHYRSSADSSDEKEIDEKDFGEVTGLELEEPISPTGTHTEAIGGSDDSRSKARWLSMLSQVKRPRIKAAASAPPPTTTSLHRLTTIALLIAIVLPAISYTNGRKKVDISGADAGVVRGTSGNILEDRADSPVDVCLRWAQQCRC
jgi:hypothetical protein